MHGLLSHIINDEHLVLTAERSIFWESERTMIVGDLHLGKTGHFRKAGIGIPQGVYKHDLQRLMHQLYFFKVDRLIIVGDFTHSVANNELEMFRKWRNDFSLLDIVLIKGNHDILANHWYAETNIQVHEQQLNMGAFTFVHDLSDYAKAKKKEPVTGYLLSGHLHPSIVVRGQGRQALKFLCYYFTPEYGVLPAFSRFTGSYQVRLEEGEQAFAIVEKEIILIEKKKSRKKTD